MKKSPTEKKDTLNTAQKRTIAKYGMGVSMATLLVTGFTKGKEAGLLHIGSGLALVGFSYWHYDLYQPKLKKE